MTSPLSAEHLIPWPQGLAEGGAVTPLTATVMTAALHLAFEETRHSF